MFVDGARVTTEPIILHDNALEPWQLIGQQRAAEGIPLLKEIIARDKQFYRAYKTLVDAYEQEKRLDDAEWYMHALIEQDPENGLASYGLGEICRRKKQYGVAAEHFTDCVRHAPETPACYIQLLESLAAYSISSVVAAEIEKRIPANPQNP